MAVNQNGFNSRITSEALEERFRQVFPAQAGAELIQDLYASGVIVPTIDFTSIAEGSFLPESLQQAWDFSTTAVQVANATTNVLNNPGFWLVDFTLSVGDFSASVVTTDATISINDGSTTKPIWGFSRNTATTSDSGAILENKFVVFLRAGDSLELYSRSTNFVFDLWYRQVATVNGTLVNPLGFTF